MTMPLPNPDLMLLAYYSQGARHLCAMAEPEDEDVDDEETEGQISVNEKVFDISGVGRSGEFVGPEGVH